jgi:hypothetical protein
MARVKVTTAIALAVAGSRPKASSDGDSRGDNAVAPKAAEVKPETVTPI